MNLCNNDHDEICFTTTHCPLCIIRSELRIDLTSVTKDYNDLEVELNELESDLESVRSDNLHYRTVLREIAPEHLL